MGIATKTMLLILLLAAILAAGEYLPRYIPKERISNFYTNLHTKASQSVTRFKEKIIRKQKQVKTIVKHALTKRAERKIVRTFQMVGGTFADKNQGIIGTSFLIRRATLFGMITSVTVHGPPGWNGGRPFYIGPLREQEGISKYLAVHWVFVQPVTGNYKALAWVGGENLEAHFFINSRSRLQPPQIVDHNPRRDLTTMGW